MRRIAMISYADAEPFHVAQMDRAQAALSSVGHVERSTAEYRRYFGQRDLLLTAQAAEAIVAWPADVVLSFMTNADLAMLAATRAEHIPIVCWSMDPVGAGLIESAQRPGGNLTGVAFAPGVQWLQLRVVKALLPSLRAVGHLYNPGYAVAPAALAHLQEAATLLGMEVVVYPCLHEDALVPVLGRMAADGMGAVIVGPHELFNRNGGRIAGLAMGHGLPAVGLDSVGTSEGVASFMPDFDRIWDAAALIADHILAGADPATTPIDRHIKPLFTLNLRSIGRLGLKAPEWLIAEADQLIIAIRAI